MTDKWLEWEEYRRQRDLKWEEEERRQDEKWKKFFENGGFTGGFTGGFEGQPAIDRSQHTNTLGVSDNATDEEIKTAYKKFALKTHPDKGGNPEDFRKYTEAYNALIKDQLGGGVRSKMTLFQALRQFNQTFPHHA
jgi:hypothetical protein